MTQQNAPESSENEFMSLSQSQSVQEWKGLTLVATPIGNLQDITFRALNMLKSADTVLCEDTRVTGKLFAAYGICTPRLSYHEHNASQRIPEILGLLKDGQRIALVSDAGTPVISDPGYRLVQACHEAGIMVTTAPGACAALSGLIMSGLPPLPFLFIGFWPRKTHEAETMLKHGQSTGATLVAYESPQRIMATLETIAQHSPDADVVIVRELTKRYETTYRGSALQLFNRLLTETVKGEITLIVSPPPAPPLCEADILTLLKNELAQGKHTKDAAETVGQHTGLPRKQLYDMAVRLKND